MSEIATEFYLTCASGHREGETSFYVHSEAVTATQVERYYNTITDCLWRATIADANASRTGEQPWV